MTDQIRNRLALYFAAAALASTTSGCAAPTGSDEESDPNGSGANQGSTSHGSSGSDDDSIILDGQMPSTTPAPQVNGTLLKLTGTVRDFSTSHEDF